MSRNAFPQLERDFTAELAAEAEAKARMLEFLAAQTLQAQADEYQRDQINEHAARQIPGNR